MTTSRLRLGQLLVDARLITPEALEDVLASQRKDGRRLGALLVERGHISEVQLTQILSHQLSVPWVSLLKIEFSRQLLNLVPREVAERYGVLPIFVRRVRGQGDTLYIATDDPTNEEALRACGAHAGLPVRPMIAPPSDVRSAIRAYYGGPTAETEPAPAPPAASTTEPAPAPVQDRASAPPTTTLEPPRAADRPTPAPAAPLAEPRPPRPLTQPSPHTQTLRSAVFDEAATAAGIRASAPAAPPAGDAPGVAPPTVREPSRPPPVPAPAPAPELSSTDDAVIELTGARRSSTPPESRPAPIPSPRGKTPRMVSLTLLDGTTLTLPARPQKRANETATAVRAVEQGRAPSPSRPPDSEPGVPSALTARDLVAALRAVANGSDASAILGDDVRWEAMFAALLSVLLKKQLIADWEFVEELSKLQKR